MSDNKNREESFRCLSFSSKNLNIERYFEKNLLDAERCAWHFKISQLITRIATHLDFSTDNALLNLYHYGLTPVVSLSPTQEIVQDIETAIPVLNGKTLQWEMDWAMESQPISTVFLKLGTGDRVNQCQLVLSLFKKDSLDKDSLDLVAVAHLDGTTARDNQWAELILDRPLLPNQYICQLQSPDADNHLNTLFLWLTVEYTQKQEFMSYCYVSPPLAVLQTELTQLIDLPRISVILAENTPYLGGCLESVVKQVYPYWELCIVADNNAVVKEYAHHFPVQIKQMTPHTSNGGNYNQGLELASGEYVMLLHPDDLLSEDALLEVVKWINQSADVDMLYSDEDKVNERGVFNDPYFKPDWAVEMLKGQMYTGQLGVYRTRLLKAIGGFREELENQALWDMVLRFTAQTRHIQHIPKILYHRRKQPPTTSKALTVKIVQDALDREGQGGRVTLNTIAPRACLVHYPVKGQPLVSIIIPTKDMAETLARCIEAIRVVTTYPHWEIIIVDNGSTEAATFALFEKYQAELGNAFTVYRHDIPFNFSKLVNQGVNVAKGDIVLLLNNDTEILGSPNWLEEMIGFAQLPEIACVGCKLLYPDDDTIQHAGLICGIGGIANHSHKHFTAESRGYFNHLAMVANYSAITGACLMVKRMLWDQVKGFDENLAVAFNDVDFCLKLLTSGLRHVVLPQVTFYHYESKTRGLENSEANKIRLTQEEAYMKQRWGTLLENDPFYNPHLTTKNEDFSLSQESIYYCRSA
jgi:GT2 family glycosyltransferase